VLTIYCCLRHILDLSALKNRVNLKHFVLENKLHLKKASVTPKGYRDTKTVVFQLTRSLSVHSIALFNNTAICLANGIRYLDLFFSVAIGIVVSTEFAVGLSIEAEKNRK
jgi:hypothetical protein